MRTGLVLLAAALVLCAACREHPSSDVAQAGSSAKAPAVMGGSAAQPAAGAAAAAEADLVMCQEHGGPEAVCTKRNPALHPVFKDKGDWCEEHGFPESFCPICHPERGGKPSRDIAAEGAPADGTKVMFKSFETAQQAGLRTVPAV